MNIAYVLNSYPKTSHTFIRREIHALERLGLSVHRFAMQGSREGLVNQADIDEERRTEYVLASGGLPLLGAAIVQMTVAPRLTVLAFLLAISLGRISDRGIFIHMIYWLEASYIARRCRKLAIAHIHAHFGTNAAAVAALVAEMGGPQFSFTVHGPEEFDRPISLGLWQKIARASFTVAVSSFGRSQLCRWSSHRRWHDLHVIHCGIEPGRFGAPPPMPTGGVRLVSIGRFVEQKGQLLMLEAFALAARRHDDMHLVMVGDGEMRADIEQMIIDLDLIGRVTLTGWLDEAAVQQELYTCHALVLASFAEGLPVVAMEAMAAGRPVIGTYIAGLPELVLAGETGWLAPAGDAAALAEAFCALAAIPNAQRMAMGLAAYRRVVSRHDIDAEAAKLRDLFLSAKAPKS